MRYTLILITIVILFIGCGEKMPSDQEMIDNFKSNRTDFEKLYDWAKADDFSHYPLFACEYNNDSMLQIAIKELKISLERQCQYDTLMHKLRIERIFREGIFSFFYTGGIGWDLEKVYVYAPNGISKMGSSDVIVGSAIDIDINELYKKFNNGGSCTIYKEIIDGWYIRLEYHQ